MFDWLIAARAKVDESQPLEDLQKEALIGDAVQFLRVGRLSNRDWQELSQVSKSCFIEAANRLKSEEIGLISLAVATALAEMLNGEVQVRNADPLAGLSSSEDYPVAGHGSDSALETSQDTLQASKDGLGTTQTDEEVLRVREVVHLASQGKYGDFQDEALND